MTPRDRAYHYEGCIDPHCPGSPDWRDVPCKASNPGAYDARMAELRATGLSERRALIVVGAETMTRLEEDERRLQQRCSEPGATLADVAALVVAREAIAELAELMQQAQAEGGIDAA